MSDVTAVDKPVAAKGTAVKPAGGGSPAISGLPTLDGMWKTVKNGDIGLALGVMVILVVLILPMPPVMLDLFLAISIIFSVLILMTALFIQQPARILDLPDRSC